MSSSRQQLVPGEATVSSPDLRTSLSHREETSYQTCLCPRSPSSATSATPTHQQHVSESLPSAWETEPSLPGLLSQRLTRGFVIPLPLAWPAVARQLGRGSLSPLPGCFSHTHMAAPPPPPPGPLQPAGSLTKLQDNSCLLLSPRHIVLSPSFLCHAQALGCHIN